MMQSKEGLIRRYQASLPASQRRIVDAVLAGERLTNAHALVLYEDFDLPLLSLLATYVRLRKNGLLAYYNRNAHIEPTNICEFSCSFCSYRRRPGQEGAWVLGLAEMVEMAREQAARGNTEVHITGGALPGWRLADLLEMVRAIRGACPGLHIKAFSAVELVAVFEREGLGYEEGLARLRDAGLGSIPGGGAEIFAPAIRRQICPDKATGEQWLNLHRAAHRVGLQTNATMLYGHIESYADRVAHLGALRALQDETGGFNCFIPLKFRAQGNPLGERGEVSLLEVLRNYAVSRLFLDNVQHLKAYWPMLGKANIGLAMAYGADDLDGTIGDSTKIYSMAGAEDARPSATVEELHRIVREAGYVPTERDSLYRPVEG